MGSREQWDRTLNKSDAIADIGSRDCKELEEYTVSVLIMDRFGDSR